MYNHWATYSCKEESEGTSENILRLREALIKAREYYLSMGKVPYITLPLLNELHTIILPRHLRPRLRNSNVYTSYKNRIHVYPEHWNLKDQILATCDLCNRLINNLKVLEQTNQLTLQTLSEVTALIVFNIISIHPYVDGNGRLCRVIAAYLLFLITDDPKVIKDWTLSLVTIRESIPMSKSTFPIKVDVKPLQTKIIEAHKGKVCNLT